jgi:RNA polymerase sigma-70 factor (ECF subfamily)
MTAVVQADDREAFGEIYTRYYGLAVYWFRKRGVSDDHKIDDLISETFLRVWQNRHQFEPGREPRPWLYRTMRNILWQFHTLLWVKLDGRRIRQVMPNTAVDRQPRPDVVACQRETVRIVRQRIARLPEGQRIAITECRIQGRPLVEIAAFNGVTRQAVDNRVQTGLQVMREDRRLLSLV